MYIEDQVPPSSRTIHCFHQKMASLKWGSRVTTQPVAAGGMRFHRLNLFSHDEIEVVSLLLGWCVNLTGAIPQHAFFRSMNSLEPVFICQ